MNVLIAGGGTGGHLFPGIALAQELKRRDPGGQILFVGTARGIETRAVPRAGFRLALLPVSGLRGRGVLGVLLGLLRLPWALWRALWLVRRFRPEVAVSVGGYAAGPAVLAAGALGVPCVVLEQNAVPGITSRLLGRIAKRVVAALPTVGFAESKVRVLGNPVRADLVPVRRVPYAPGVPLRLLVFGGSQGARALNDVMLAAAPRLAGVPVRIVHQTGSADLERVRAGYARAGCEHAMVLSFIDDMATAYRDADLVLCRAGATSIAELTVCGRPAVLVPFPFAAGDHQTANAKTLAAAGAAWHIPQHELDADRLVNLLEELRASPQILVAMAEQARALGKPEAAAAIADTVQECAHV